MYMDGNVVDRVGVGGMRMGWLRSGGHKAEWWICVQWYR